MRTTRWNSGGNERKQLGQRADCVASLCAFYLLFIYYLFTIYLLSYLLSLFTILTPTLKRQGDLQI